MLRKDSIITCNSRDIIDMSPSLKNKHVLLTGAAGFIGSHLCDRLLKEQLKSLIAVDNLFLGSETNLTEAKKYKNFFFKKLDVSDVKKVTALFQQNQIDVIFHLGVIPLEVSLTDPVFCFEQNVAMTLNLLEQIRQSGKKISLVLFSSSEVYGTARYTPMNELHPLFPNTPYAASKAASDLLALSYAKSFQIDLVIIRPFNNYGPRQNEGSYAGLIPLTIKRVLLGEKPVIYGDGNQTRDFIFVRDTVNLTVDIVKKTRSQGEIYNLASGKQISVAAVIRTICQQLNYRGELEYRPARPGDVKIHQGDIQKLGKLLKFSHPEDFTAGIKKTITWYKNK